MKGLEKYFVGKGVDTSIKKSKDLKSTKHIYRTYDNTYRLHPDAEFESLDFIYNKNSINTTKFSIILLTEWIRYIKKDGYLIITFSENKLLNRKKIYYIYKKYLSKNSKIVLEINNKKEVTIIFQKTKSQLIKHDSIDKWTFGIVTIGKRNEWVRKFIESVRAQKIPNYEILIVGTWDDPTVDKRDIRYIHFNKKDDKGWTTKKKNIAFKEAKYENVIILHDRFYFDKNWFKGMKKYGNSWDIIFFPIIDKNGTEYVAWSVWGHGFLPLGYVDIRDWDEDYYAGGTFMAAKRSIYNKVPLSEDRFWGEQEDSNHGLRLIKEGYITRANPYSKIHTTVTYIHDAPVYTFDNKKLGKPLEYRGKKWIIIQPIVDVMTRMFGLPFLRARRALSIFLTKYTKLTKALTAGEKRD